MANKISKSLESIGRGVGGVVNALFQAGRDTIDQVVKNILPFIAFISLIIGIINASGVGDAIAQGLTALAGSVIGLLILSIIVGFPVLSPLLGPGAVVAQVVGTLMGSQIPNGNLDPTMSLPALWAINPQVGCDFIPVGLSLGEAEPETVEIGVPAVLFSRMVTGPAAVIIGWAASAGLYTG